MPEIQETHKLQKIIGVTEVTQIVALVEVLDPETQKVHHEEVVVNQITRNLPTFDR